jgi:maltooligosyltrehalose trehalohydrolase
MVNPHLAAAPEIPEWRRYPIGTEVGPDGVVHCRLWAQKQSHVSFATLTSSGRIAATTELEPEGNGYFSAVIPSAEPGTLYKLRLGDSTDVPDPTSRFQPDGPHGPSQIVDARGYAWRDRAWRGPSLPEAVIYELHVGSFTQEGTYAAAARHLRELAELGIGIIEMMPVAEFPGRFGWGYDGVGLFAPYHHYGTPDDLRRFIDDAHGFGIGVVLDVVYNHLGPDGNYLREFSEHYFKGSTEWGDALNFDGEDSGPVRELFTCNAAYWTEEFHFDGLRLDATQQIFDTSTPHIIAEIGSRVRDAADGRRTVLIAENEPQNSTLVRPLEQGGCALDGMWNDDFHHSAIVAVTGRDEAYYSGYRGTAQELVSGAKYGFLYQGQWYEWQLGRRGSPAYDIAPFHLINFTQNHDQVANAAAGLRIDQLTSPGRHRAITALLLLLPQTPMLFQGQEFAASAPFLYFADHNPDLAKLVRRGRSEFLGQFAHIATPETSARLDDPSSESTFLRCKLDWSERHRGAHAATLALVGDLIRLRRSDPTFRRQSLADRSVNTHEEIIARPVDGAVLGDGAFVLRYFGETREQDRLIAVNLGRRLHAAPLAEPLIAPPKDMLWRPIWSSEAPTYGGFGTPPIDTDNGGWWLPAESAIVLAPVRRDNAAPMPRQATSEKEARALWKERYEATA